MSMEKLNMRKKSFIILLICALLFAMVPLNVSAASLNSSVTTSSKKYKYTKLSYKPKSTKTTTKTTYKKCTTPKTGVSTINKQRYSYKIYTDYKYVTVTSYSSYKSGKKKLYMKKEVTTTYKTVRKIYTKIVDNKIKDGTYKIEEFAPKADACLLNVFNAKKFTFKINSKQSVNGIFNPVAKSITLKEKSDCVYHELGHFLNYLTIYSSNTGQFISIYFKERSKYNGSLKDYVLQNSSEYFAESYKDYCCDKNNLKKNRPETYAYLEKALKYIESGMPVLHGC